MCYKDSLYKHFLQIILLIYRAKEWLILPRTNVTYKFLLWGSTVRVCIYLWSGKHCNKKLRDITERTLGSFQTSTVYSYDYYNGTRKRFWSSDDNDMGNDNRFKYNDIVIIHITVTITMMTMTLMMMITWWRWWFNSRRWSWWSSDDNDDDDDDDNDDSNVST